MRNGRQLFAGARIVRLECVAIRRSHLFAADPWPLKRSTEKLVNLGKQFECRRCHVRPPEMVKIMPSDELSIVGAESSFVQLTA